MSTKKTTWVNIRATREHDVYVGRPKAGDAWGFGNPFKIDRDGARGECIPKFQRWLETGDAQGCPDATEARRQWILARIPELRGKVLGCFCHPAKCHAEVLAELADTPETEIPDFRCDICRQEDCEGHPELEREIATRERTFGAEFERQKFIAAQRPLQPVTLYTDGSCPGNSTSPSETYCGLVGLMKDGARGWGLVLGPGTNQTAELAAIREAIQKLVAPEKFAVTVYTDSQYAIGCLTNPKWNPRANVELIAEVKAATARCGSFEMVHVKGHAGHVWNEWTDRLAARARKHGECRVQLTLTGEEVTP